MEQPKNACSYADISVSNIDKMVFCRDDIKPTVRFTVRFDHQKLEFLDVLVYKDKGTLHTTVFSKETDGHMSLLPSSAHFHSVSRNIPYNEHYYLGVYVAHRNNLNKCEEYKA